MSVSYICCHIRWFCAFSQVKFVYLHGCVCVWKQKNNCRMHKPFVEIWYERMYILNIWGLLCDSDRSHIHFRSDALRFSVFTRNKKKLTIIHGSCALRRWNWLNNALYVTSSKLAIPLQTITNRDFALLGCHLMVNRVHKPSAVVSLYLCVSARAFIVCVCVLEMVLMQVWSKIQTIYEIAWNGFTHRKFHSQSWNSKRTARHSNAYVNNTVKTFE